MAKTPHKRAGNVTKAEKALAVQFIKDQPADLTPKQERALAVTMNRSLKTVRKIIEEARMDFGEQAQRYVEVHKRAVENALANGENDIALKGAQWAMQNMSAEGKRVIDKPESGPQGSRVMIGIKIGGVDQKAISAGVVESE